MSCTFSALHQEFPFAFAKHLSGEGGVTVNNPFTAGNASSDKALRKLSRKDLLRLLISQMEENEQLKAQLAQAQEQLASREVVKEKAGSLAEASVLLSGVLEAAEEASLVYLENIKRMEAQLQAQLESQQAQEPAQPAGKHARGVCDAS